MDFLNGMMGTVLKFEPLFCGDPWMDVLVQGHMTNDSFTRKQDNLHSTGRMIHLYLLYCRFFVVLSHLVSNLRLSYTIQLKQQSTKSLASHG